MRYAVLASAVLMQMCLGATYSWSIFVLPLRDLTALQQGPVQIPFSTFYFIFPFTVMIAGSLLNRLGPRKCAVIGGLLFGGGWMVAGLGEYSFALTVTGIGVLAGIGAGLAYLVPIDVGIRWFPKNKGLVTGVAVAGFGGGAAVVSQIGGFLMGEHGWSPFSVFTLFGVLFLLTISTAGSLMGYPPAQHTRVHQPPSPPTPGNLPLDRTFQLLYLAMFLGLAAGFAINANLKDLGPAANAQLGVTGVSLFAIANAAGRVSWGMIFDRITPPNAIGANLLSQAILLLLSPFLLDSPGGFLLFAALAGFNYGGVLVVYVSTVSAHWGADRVGKVYGLLFTANIPAAISPVLAGVLFDMTGSFQPALQSLAILLGLGTLIALISLRRRLS